MPVLPKGLGGPKGGMCIALHIPQTIHRWSILFIFLAQDILRIAMLGAGAKMPHVAGAAQSEGGI